MSVPGTTPPNQPRARTQRPATEEYYLASFKHRGIGGFVLWWGPNNAGYYTDLQSAGIYTGAQINAKPNYYDNEETIPVPVWFINLVRVYRQIDPSHSENGCFRASNLLREAIAEARKDLLEASI